jgi:hypothetical protein
LGPIRDRFQRIALTLLEDIAAGRAVRRRDALAVARAELESAAVRAAEAVLEADDQQLLPRLAELLNAVLADGQSKPTERENRSSIE